MFLWRKALPYVAFGGLGVAALIRGIQGDTGNLALAAVLYFVIGYDLVIEFQNKKPSGQAPMGSAPLRIVLWPVEMILAVRDFFWRRRRADRFKLCRGFELETRAFRTWRDAVGAARELAKSEGREYQVLDNARFVYDDGRWEFAVYSVEPTGKVRRG